MRTTSILAHIASLDREEWAALGWLRSIEPRWTGPVPPRDDADEITELAVAAAESLARLAWQDHPARLARWRGPLADLGDGCGPRWLPGDALGLVRARCSDDWLWERDPDAAPMLCLPIISSVFAVPDDLAVFHVDNPARVWFLQGRCTAQHASEIVEGSGPLLLHSDLLSWTRARGAGAVILDIDRWAPTLIERGRPIHCATLELAERLEQALRRARPKLPKLFVLGPKREAA